MKNNESILAMVETLGGGYVWDADIFAVTLFDVPLTDSDVAILSGLQGVQQIALNATNLTFSTIESIARISGLESLVLCHNNLTDEQISALLLVGPDIELVSNDT